MSDCLITPTGKALSRCIAANHIKVVRGDINHLVLTCDRCEATRSRMFKEEPLGKKYLRAMEELQGEMDQGWVSHGKELLCPRCI